MCVSGHCAPQPHFSFATEWGAYDTWVFRGSRAWSKEGVVHRSYVLLVCRKFWLWGDDRGQQHHLERREAYHRHKTQRNL
jgi:hypothetical protein